MGMNLVDGSVKLQCPKVGHAREFNLSLTVKQLLCEIINYVSSTTLQSLIGAGTLVLRKGRLSFHLFILYV